MRQVHARDTEASRRDLLDRAAALGVEQSLDVLAALARVGLAADAVHRDRERLVRFLGDGAVAHRTRLEPLEDLRCRLDLVDRDRGTLAHLEFEEAAQRHRLGRLVVDQLRVFLEDVVATLASGVLEAEDRVRVEEVRRSLSAPLVLPADVERTVRRGRGLGRVGVAVAQLVLAGDALESHARDLAGRASEVLPHKLVREADGLEALSSRVRRDCRDAHLRHDLQDALAERLDEVRDRLLLGDARELALADHVLAGLHREIRVHGGRPVAEQDSDVVDLAHVTRLDDKPDAHASLGANEVVVHGAGHEQ